VWLQTVKFQELEWSLWDRWILEGDLTVQQVLDWFKVCLASAFHFLWYYFAVLSAMEGANDA